MFLKERKKKGEKSTWYFYDIPLTKETFLFALYILSIIVAICILTDSIIIKSRLAICSFFFLCFCAWNYHAIKLDDKQNLYKKVAWISDIYSQYGLRPSHLRDLKLYEYIEIEQRNQQIPQQYRIDFSNETEKEYLSQILNKHKEHVIEYYFCNHLKETKGIYKLTSLEYYFFSLHCFVYDNLLYHKDNAAYEKKEYISDYQFKCQLTEYGRVYYKLELITRSYIERNDKVQNLFEHIDKERNKSIMEILEKNEVSFLS